MPMLCKGGDSVSPLRSFEGCGVGEVDFRSESYPWHLKLPIGPRQEEVKRLRLLPAQDRVW
jgi:hypothetical protein